MSTGEKIKTRGYWFVRIRPEHFPASQSHRLGDLEQAVQACAVSLRGWNYPHYSDRGAPVRYTDYVEQTLDWQHYVELWRAYKSTQFISMNGMWEDWREQSDLWPPPQGWRAGQSLMVEEAIFRLTEIYEFARRWLQTMNVHDSAVVSYTIHGLNERHLTVGPGRLPFFSPRTCHVPEWSNEQSHSMTELFAQPRELAVSPAISLFELFGWDVNAKLIRDIQSQLRD